MTDATGRLEADLYETIARRFHEEYEARAAQHGWETQVASNVPWPDVPKENRELMIATVIALLRCGVIDPGPNLGCCDVCGKEAPHGALDVDGQRYCDECAPENGMFPGERPGRVGEALSRERAGRWEAVKDCARYRDAIKYAQNAFTKGGHEHHCDYCKADAAKMQWVLDEDGVLLPDD